MAKQVITMESSDGDVVATKAGQGEAWHIGAPWSDERFFGSVPECKARIKKIIKAHGGEVEA